MEHIKDGISAQEMFKSKEGITYKDFLTLPGYIDFTPDDVNLETNISRNHKINIPIISSPMDTVTEDKMAIGMALIGGLGIIHANNTIEEQAREVERVKRYENGFINDPILLSPDNEIKDILAIKRKYGFSGIPITQDGTINSKLVGIVSNRDIDFEKDSSKKIKEIMSTDLVTAEKGISLASANEILKNSKKGKLPIVNKDGTLVSLICRRDLIKNKEFPLASKDSKKRLLVGAAVSTQNVDKERIAALVEKGVDILVIDSAQGYSSYQIEFIKFIKKTYPEVDVMAGNVVTSEQALALIKAGADSLRIGMGPGSICITQDTMACGRGQASAVYHTALIAKQHNIPVIADGGVTNIGDITKALAIGGASVMVGSLLAGTQEAPGEYFYDNGVRLKKYRGMASLEAMEAGGGKRYFAEDQKIRVAQGVSGTVLDKGTLFDFVPYLIQGVKHSFQDMGLRNIPALHEALYSEELRFERRSLAAQVQGGVHNLYSFKKPIIGAE